MANKIFHCLCDRCHRVLGPPQEYEPEPDLPTTFVCVFFTSKVKRTKMHFCSDKCKLIFLKGRKYWNRKMKLRDPGLIKMFFD